jgi:homoserine O-succinyltransferase
MAVQYATGRAHRWTCALVNNMPDGAFAATERQFVSLLDAASGDDVVELRRYAMDGVPRAATRALIEREYLPLAALFEAPPDLLIVTGSEPRTAKLEDELYWDDLAELLGWASENCQSMLLSCLAAHAALAVFDGLPREQLSVKCTGVFDQRVQIGHPLVAGLGQRVVLPHSRLNEVSGPALLEAGYRLALESEATGWGLATKHLPRCQLVLLQGHPEYDPSSLLREYHRDLQRYLAGERDGLPALPWHCVEGPDWAALAALQQRLVDGHREPGLLGQFPFEAAGARAGWPWRGTAVTLFSNWLASSALMTLNADAH